MYVIIQTQIAILNLMCYLVVKLICVSVSHKEYCERIPKPKSSYNLRSK